MYKTRANKLLLIWNKNVLFRECSVQKMKLLLQMVSALFIMIMLVGFQDQNKNT